RTVFVAVDLLEDQTENRGVYQAFALLADLFTAFRREIVSIQKPEEIVERIEAVASLLVEHTPAVDRHVGLIIQAGDPGGLALEWRNVKQRAVQIGNVAILVIDPFRTFVPFSRQYLKEKF